MSYEITRHNEVGQADHGWLNAKHYFSFANYYNPKKMGFGRLRVINDDVVQPGRGFGTHPHRDMEIITIPLSGVVSHEDSMGTKGTVGKGEVQVMSAGRGVMHSEFNHSKEQALNLFQIWIEPNKLGVEPRYAQQPFRYHDSVNHWTQLVSPIDKESEPGLKIHQNAFINAALLQAGEKLVYQTKGSGNGVYVLLAKGEINVLNQNLVSRDAIAIAETPTIEIDPLVESEVIVIEVPMT